MPLMWAHAEYIKLLRSAADGQVFDFIPEVAKRYLGQTKRKQLEVWKPNRQVGAVEPGWTLRIQAPAAFQLHWTDNDWQEVQKTRSTSTILGIEFVDIFIKSEQRAPICFTFYWLEKDKWEGQDYKVTINHH